jgi:hypothetical protein
MPCSPKVDIPRIPLIRSVIALKINVILELLTIKASNTIAIIAMTDKKVKGAVKSKSCTINIFLD